jgi:hypothetical protein
MIVASGYGRPVRRTGRHCPLAGFNEPIGIAVTPLATL